MPPKRIAAQSQDAHGESAQSEFDRFFDNTLSPMIVAGFDGCTTRVNHACERLTEITADEFRSKPFLDFIHPDDREIAELAILEMGATGASREVEIRIRCKSGEYKWTEWAGTPMLDRQTFYLSGKDVTEQRLAQGALQARLQADQDFERFFNNAPDVMFAGGYDGYITRVNAALEALTGFTREQLLAEPILAFAHPDDRDRVSAEIQKVISGGIVRGFEVRVRCADGSYKQVVWNAANFADRRVFYAIGADVTARRIAEAALAERARQREAVAELGSRALESDDLEQLLADAATSIAEFLRLDYAGILELQQDKPECLLRAGYGWEPGIAGEMRVSAEPDRCFGYMLSANEPVIVTDLRSETRFRDSDALREHNVVGGMGCIIPSSDRTYGVLAVFSTKPRTFTEDEAHFLEAAANILAGAIERQRAHDELDRFFTPALNPMFIGRFDGYVKRLNRATELLTGFSSKEILAEPFLNFVHPDDQALAAKEVQTLVAGGTTASIEIRVRCRDGSYKWTNWSATSFPDWQVFYAIGYDVSDRHAVEAALGEREEEFRALLDSLAEGVFGLDLEGKCTFSNAACRRLLGYDAPADMLGKSIHDVLQHSHPDGTPMPVKDCPICRALCEERESHACNEELRRRDGTSFPAEYWSYPIRKTGTVAGCVVSFLDISQRVNAEAERDRFFNHPLTPMCVLGFDGYFKNMNPVCGSMFGYTRDELMSQPFVTAVHPDDQERAAALARGIMSSGQSQEYEIRILCKDGSYKWMAWSAVPFPEQQAFYAVGHDVTDRRVAEGLLAQRASQQQAIAELGGRALAGGDLGPFFDEAVVVLARTLRVEFATLLELQPTGDEFLLKAGYGWEPELIGKTRMPADPQFLCGYMLSCEKPVIVEDIAAESRFRAHPLGIAHGIVSEMACVVPGGPRSYGVLCVHCLQPRRFTEDDVHFLQSLANILAAAIERRRAEEELNRFFEPSLNPMFVAGFDGMVKRCNHAAELLFGYTREELQALPLVSLAHPGDRQIAIEGLQRMAAGDAAPAFEIRIVCKDGSEKWTIWNGTSFPDCQTFYATGQDVTDRHLAVEALRVSEETLRAAGESALDGIVRLDPNGKVAQWNAAAERMFGFTSEEILGRDLHLTLLPDESRASYEQGWPRFRQTGQGSVIGKVQELEALRKDGSRIPVEVSIAPVLLYGQWNAVGIIRDITQRKHDEAELIAAKQAAESANRSKSEFLANMSHEIRTPMNGIIGLTSLVLDTPLSKEQRQYLDGVMLSAEALLKIINDILDFSKIEAGRLELEKLEFDLRETLGNAMRTLALRAHEKGLELLYEVRPEAPDALVGDPARLWQVLINLVGNAVKFTDQGEVSVSVAVESLESDTVCLRFTVTDTGIGIPADKQQTLFKPFSQADSSMSRKYGGTGLGLAISAQIVEMMKGRIWFVSEPGKGSRFQFTACFDLRSTPLPNRAPLPPSGLDGLHVLTVDDNATNRKIVLNMLMHWGMRPVEADGGIAALDLLRAAYEAADPFGLILLDVMMPGMDGFAVLERIRQMPEIDRPVIMMLSSRDQPGDAARARALGAAVYIVKPIRPSELLDAIVRALGITFESGIEQPTLPPKTFAEPRGPGLRILVAEDNPINQMLAVRILEKAGHSVAVADNGQEVLAALAREVFELVLMDVQMPGMDGFEATALIRQQEIGTARHLPIIAMTAHAMKGDREKCLEAGMDGYVAKPVQKDELFVAIAAAVPSKTPAAAQ